MVFLTGDTHRTLDIRKLNTKNWPESRTLTKDDVLIILGDFGLLWSNVPRPEEKYWLDWLEHKPFTTLVVDGNHENHSRLLELSVENKFGADIGVISNSIYHLKRGRIYTIEGKEFFCMGGAQTVDMYGRVEGVDWWRGEIASWKEMDDAIGNLESHNNEVDYIIAHTLPTNIIKKYMAKLDIPIKDVDKPEQYELMLDEVAKQMCLKYNDPMARFLQEVCDRVKFKHYYCGHFHDDVTIDNFTILYDTIVKL